MNFKPIYFNTEEAQKSGATSPFFEGNTEQEVQIVRAEFIESPKTGAQGIEFDVINRNKEKGYFTIWHLKGDGSINEYSYRTLQSIMGICGVQTLIPEMVSVMKYDFNQRENVSMVCPNAKALLGKIFVGLFVETYSEYNGELKSKMELFQAFTRERKSYREHNANVPANDIVHATEAMLKKSKTSKDNAERALQNNQAYRQHSFESSQQNNPPTWLQTASIPPTNSASGYGFDDEDLPF